MTRPRRPRARRPTRRVPPRTPRRTLPRRRPMRPPLPPLPPRMPPRGRRTSRAMPRGGRRTWPGMPPMQPATLRRMRPARPAMLRVTRQMRRKMPPTIPDGRSIGPQTRHGSSLLGARGSPRAPAWRVPARCDPAPARGTDVLAADRNAREMSDVYRPRRSPGHGRARPPARRGARRLVVLPAPRAAARRCAAWASGTAGRRAVRPVQGRLHPDLARAGSLPLPGGAVHRCATYRRVRHLLRRLDDLRRCGGARYRRCGDRVRAGTVQVGARACQPGRGRPG